MVVSFFFLMNLILAVVVSAYDSAVETLRGERITRSQAHLREAFELLDRDGLGSIDRETVMALFLILNLDFPEFRTLTDEECRLHFALLDKDGSNSINREEFMEFGTVMLLEFVKESDYATLVQRCAPKIFVSARFQRYCAFAKSDAFEYSIDFVIFLNAVVVGIQSYPELSGQDVEIDAKYWDGSIDTAWGESGTPSSGLECESRERLMT